jgi:FAD/FMN-containing dehydrogenase
MASAIAHFRGALIRPGDPGYHSARTVWNGMIDRKPAIIARCLDVADVQAAVAHARSEGLGVAIRGGGHNAAGLAVADGALVVDLTGMRAVDVDPTVRTARVQGGATWGDVDRATQEHGLATTGGAISDTGVGGLTLGGGLGWLMRSYGLACDSVIAAEVVTATGELVRTSETENPELLWGLKGGGGNFGVVTSFAFALHPVSTLLAGLIIHPVERAPEVLRFYREFNATAPEELIAFAALMTTPDGARVLGLIVAYNGPVEDGERVLKPLREFGPPVADMVSPMPYTALQTMLDEGFPAGLPVYWRSHFLPTLTDEALDLLVDGFARATSPLTSILLEQLGGAVARVPREDSAFDHRAAQYNLAIIARWPDPAMAEECIAWTRKLWTDMEPHGQGVYVNYLGEHEGQDRVRAAYGPGKYDRLATLKRQYDPTNLFRFNHNIVP